MIRYNSTVLYQYAERLDLYAKLAIWCYAIVGALSGVTAGFLLMHS